MNQNRVGEFRRKLGLTQVELARRTHIASTNLSSIECGRLLAWPKAKRRIAKALNIKVDELFPSDGGENHV